MSATLNLDPATSIHTANFLAYFGVILAIWSVEAVRSCNALMPVQLQVFINLVSHKVTTDKFKTCTLCHPCPKKRLGNGSTFILLPPLGLDSHRHLQSYRYEIDQDELHSSYPSITARGLLSSSSPKPFFACKGSTTTMVAALATVSHHSLACPTGHQQTLEG
jgi:hypothetical protein